MRLCKLEFAGYRSFAARSPASQSRPLQRLHVAPLTVVLGKNNSGKSTLTRFIRHLLVALASDGESPFPMRRGKERFGADFREVQHNGLFFNPLDLVAELQEGSGRASFAARLVTDSADDPRPVVLNRRIGDELLDDRAGSGGLLSSSESTASWRDGARRLLSSSAYVGPIRERVQAIYEAADERDLPLPADNDAAAQWLLRDPELRGAVSDWFTLNLEGWKLELRQNLESFVLAVRRGAQESNLSASGQGIQQVLPVVALCEWRRLGRGRHGGEYLDIIEQPELHLHDAAHAALGDLLIRSLQAGEGSLVVETHSEALVLRLRRRIAEGLLDHRALELVYVHDTEEGSEVQSIPVASDGEVGWWPEGVFSEAFVEVKAIRRAQKASKSAE